MELCGSWIILHIFKSVLITRRREYWMRQMLRPPSRAALPCFFLLKYFIHSNGETFQAQWSFSSSIALPLLLMAVQFAVDVFRRIKYFLRNVLTVIHIYRKQLMSAIHSHILAVFVLFLFLRARPLLSMLRFWIFPTFLLMIALSSLTFDIRSHCKWNPIMYQPEKHRLLILEVMVARRGYEQLLERPWHYCRASASSQCLGSC